MVRYVKKDVRLWELLKKYRYPALILVLGLMLMLLPGGKKDGQEDQEAVPEPGEENQLEQFSRQLETLLSGIQGAGEVRLLLTLETDGQTSYLTDSAENQGADSTQTQRQAVLARVDGNDQPVVRERTYPTFRGALVLCQGGDDPSVRLSVKEAVSSLTGLGMDRITVLSMN